MRTITTTLILLVLLLGLGAGAVMAGPGGNGNGRAVGRGDGDAASPHVDSNGGRADVAANGPSASGRVQATLGGEEQVADPPRTAQDTLSLKPRVFSAHGTFARWLGERESDDADEPSAEGGDDPVEGRVMEIALESCSRIVRDAALSVDLDAGGAELLRILVDDQTRYHVRGGGGGFSTGPTGLAVPVGAGVHIVGTAYITLTPDGQAAATPSPLYATRILFQLDEEDDADDD